MLSSPWGNLHSPGKGSLQRLHHDWYPKDGKSWGKEATHRCLSAASWGQAGGLWQWQAHSPWPLIQLPLRLCALASCTQVPQHLGASLYDSDQAWEKGVTCSRAAVLYLPNTYSQSFESKNLSRLCFLIFTAVAIGSSAISIYFLLFLINPRASAASY